MAVVSMLVAYVAFASGYVHTGLQESEARSALVQSSTRDLWTQWARDHPLPDVRATPDGLALVKAIQHRDFGALLQLYAKNVDVREMGRVVNYHDWEAVPPLYVAAREGAAGMCRSLLARGADVNAISLFRNTALHGAAEIGSRFIVELLLQAGAHVDVPNNEGETALAVAAWNENEEIVELLLAHGADVDGTKSERATISPLWKATADGEISMMKLLLSHGANPSGKFESGTIETPLHTCFYFNSIVEAELLLQHGADVNKKDGKGRTPLHMALLDNWTIGLVELFLKYGADVHAVNAEGKTCLDYVDTEEEKELIRRYATKRTTNN